MIMQVIGGVFWLHRPLLNIANRKCSGVKRPVSYNTLLFVLQAQIRGAIYRSIFSVSSQLSSRLH